MSVRRHGMYELYRGGWRAVPESSEHGWDEAMNSRENRIDKRVRVGLEGAPQVLCVLLHILWVSSGDTVECVFVYKNSTYGMRSSVPSLPPGLTNLPPSGCSSRFSSDSAWSGVVKRK